MSGLTWALGTFHTTVIGIALLLLVYPGGSLGTTLGALSTITGLALFVALWTTTLFCTGRAIRGVRLLGGDRASTGAFYRRALRWGAVNGVLFAIALVAILAANALAVAEPSVGIGTMLAIAGFQGTFGSLFGLAIGAVAGLVLATLDLAALRLARSLSSAG
jgi:hypothetical protein